MPLIFTEPFATIGRLGLWEITEDLPELARSFRGSPADVAEAEGIAHPQKRLEFLASRALVQQLAEVAGLVFHGLEKDEFGKPTLVGHSFHLSITHGPRHAAAVLHPTQPVGIDLEAPGEQLRRVAHRILSPTELTHADGDLRRLAVYWTAKEALYKLYGRRGVFFSTQLLVDPFADGDAEVVGWIHTEVARQRCLIQLRWLAGGVLAVSTVADPQSTGKWFANEGFRENK